jgi:TolB protein
VAAGVLAPRLGRAQLDITVTGGEFRPIAIAMPNFMGDSAGAQAVATDVSGVIANNLVGCGLFRAIPREAHIQTLESLDAAPRFADWRAINAEALLAGDVRLEADGRLRTRFRLYDVATGQQLEGLEFFGDPEAWRRVAHKVSDAVYSSLTGESGYFDSRIAFIDETGAKGARRKRLALMDQDGANLRYLSDGSDLVLMPRFSPRDQDILFISYASGGPRVSLMNLDTGQREALGSFPGMTFAPRFSPDGRWVAMSLAQNGNSDIYLMQLATRSVRRLTASPAIDTSPSFSPDGTRIAFESDRGGGQQIYVMETAGGEATARRISFGEGRYGAPVWSPRGDLIAFTRLSAGRFDIGVMRADGGGERILDSGFHAEGPTWSPNGRVLAFFRETPGERGGSALWSVDISGVKKTQLRTPNGASDPAWSPLLP